MAGAVFGDVAALLFVAGAVFGEIWIDSQSAKFCNFLTKCVADGEKVSSANGWVQFCNFMFGSWGDHAQVVRHCKARFICFQQIVFIILECHFALQGQFLVTLEGGCCCHESHFSWQAQCLVLLEDDFCCSTHCK